MEEHFETGVGKIPIHGTNLLMKVSSLSAVPPL